MNDAYNTVERLRLVEFGYKIIPNSCKETRYKGWSKADYTVTVEHIKEWPREHPAWRATGLLVRDGLLIIDIDIEDGPAQAALITAIAGIAPEVAARAPTRYGGGEYKLALVCRVDMNDPMLFSTHSSAKYFRPDQDPETDKGHMVELFGSKPTPKGTCAKQIGIYGPHTIGKKGEVLIEYVWAKNAGKSYPLLALHEIRPEDLPLITCKQAFAVIDAFEAWATAAGWTRKEKPDIGNAGAVYDITDATRFDTDRAGKGLTYQELCYAFTGDRSLRCTTSFIAGRHGESWKCQVGDANPHGCVAVFVYGDDAVHYPAEFAPVDQAAAFAEVMKDVFDDPPIPPDVPNWRERFVGSGMPKASLHNAKLAVTAVGLTCSSDVFHNRMLIGRGAAPASLDICIGALSDERVALLRGWLSNAYGFDLTEQHLRDAIMELCALRPFDPVVDMLADAELNWDKVERLDRMAVDHFNCEDTKLNRAFVRKFMIAAVARARRPGILFHEIPVLESKEGWNKSRALAVLAGDDNFADVDLLGEKTREVIELTSGAWIVELSDLKNIRRADVASVKAFASRHEDKARMAYGHFVVVRPRRFVVAGTTNEEQYLLSQTGNRRFWPLRVRAPIDIAKLTRQRLQLWGEAAHWQSQDESLRLSESLWEEAGAAQDLRRLRDTWEEVLHDLEPVTGQARPSGTCIIQLVGNEQRIATLDFFREALGMQGWQMNRTDGLRLADVMRTNGWVAKRFQVKGEDFSGYVKTVIKVA